MGKPPTGGPTTPSSSFKRPRNGDTAGEVYDSSRSRSRGPLGSSNSRPTKFTSFSAASASFPDHSPRNAKDARGGGREGVGDGFNSSSFRNYNNISSSSSGSGGGGGGSSFNGGSSSSSFSSFSSASRDDAYRPRVIPPSFPPSPLSSSSTATLTMGRKPTTTSAGGEKKKEQDQRKIVASPSSSSQGVSTKSNSDTIGGGGGGGRIIRGALSSLDRRSVVVILTHCGLQLGRNGRLVDAYELSTSLTLRHPSLLWARPDIVHQCLLALFDSELAHQQQLRVYLQTCRPSYKVIEVSPTLRPPRTYRRFKGLMASVLRDGQVLARSTEERRQTNFPSPSSSYHTRINNNRRIGAPFSSLGNDGFHGRSGGGGGGALLRILPGSLAPIFPEGVECTGICNDLSKPVTTTSMLASEAIAHPVEDDAHQGGLKEVFGFYCISCTEEGVTVRLEGSGGHRLSPHTHSSRFPSSRGKRNPEDDNDDEEEGAGGRRRQEEEEDVAGSFPSSSPSTFVASPSSAQMMQEVDYVTRIISPSAYPIPAHVMCARLCEGFSGSLMKMKLHSSSSSSSLSLSAE